MINRLSKWLLINLKLLKQTVAAVTISKISAATPNTALNHDILRI